MMEESTVPRTAADQSASALGDGSLLETGPRPDARARVSRLTDVAAPLPVEPGDAYLPTVGAPAVPAVAPAAAPASVTEVVLPRTTVDASEWDELASRVLNVVFAAVLLLILAPVCVIVAALVKLTSPGPVFYTQTRVGLDRRWNRTAALRERRIEDLGGLPFTILKFRSMRTDAEANGQAIWATKHDARVTPIGRVLRKTRLDEIPQLINVLRGDMNIVGPRPERPSIVVRLRASIPEYPHRHRVKPGITGWAQINHSYDSCLEDVRRKVELDLEYIARRSVWFDLRIMLSTVPVMVFRRGAH
jgi:lipopolysaccharide/colanic/teichoic acid biosynthesis glycosyltransferase